MIRAHRRCRRGRKGCPNRLGCPDLPRRWSRKRKGHDGLHAPADARRRTANEIRWRTGPSSRTPRRWNVYPDVLPVQVLLSKAIEQLGYHRSYDNGSSRPVDRSKARGVCYRKVAGGLVGTSPGCYARLLVRRKKRPAEPVIGQRRSLINSSHLRPPPKRRGKTREPERCGALFGNVPQGRVTRPRLKMNLSARHTRRYCSPILLALLSYWGAAATEAARSRCLLRC